MNKIFTVFSYHSNSPSLQDEKAKILDEVMDKETYKVATKILERFDPSRLQGGAARPGAVRPPGGGAAASPMRPGVDSAGMELRKRGGPPQQGPQQQQGPLQRAPSQPGPQQQGPPQHQLNSSFAAPSSAGGSQIPGQVIKISEIFLWLMILTYGVMIVALVLLMPCTCNYDCYGFWRESLLV